MALVTARPHAEAATAPGLQLVLAAVLPAYTAGSAARRQQHPAAAGCTALVAAAARAAQGSQAKPGG